MNYLKAIIVVHSALFMQNHNKLMKYNINSRLIGFLLIKTCPIYFLSFMRILPLVQFSLKLSQKLPFKTIPMNVDQKHNTPNPQLKAKDLC